LAEIEKELDWVRLAAGDWLFREGDPADAAYLVAAGRLQIVSGEGAHEEFVAEIGRGEIVGEMAVIEGGTRTASAVAIRDTQLVRVPDSAVSLILERFPQVFLHLTRMVLRRARRPARQSIAEQLSVAVVPLAPIAEVRDLCAQLSAGLSTLGATVHLWSDRVDALLGRSGIAQSSGTAAGDVRLVPWLNEVESASRFVIFETDSQWSAWSERVLRQCDRVLFVADANGPMAVSPLEAQGLATLSGRRHPHTSLVLLHDPATGLPSGTSRWLEHRPVDDVHHLRRGFGGDVSRVVRILAGKGVSLVLSGGGARGFAQLGVIRAMHEVGIPIDLVAGTSIGSVIGAGVALDLDDDEAASLVADRFRNIMDWTLPVVSVLRGKRISANLVAQFGMTEIEDLWLPYLCVSASLTRPRAVVHRRGSVATAIRASVAIPGVLPPVPYGDELLVDGGVIDNLPVAVMRRVNPNGPLVAVDVTPAADSRPNAAFGLSLSGWEAIRMRLASKGKSQTLSLSGTVLASMLIGATRDRDRVIEEDLADLYLAVDAGNCGPFDWDAVARVAATGYRSALPAVAAWASELGW
jgi:predicted acylesterase/phospholipase RssA